MKTEIFNGTLKHGSQTAEMALKNPSLYYKYSQL